MIIPRSTMNKTRPCTDEFQFKKEFKPNTGDEKRDAMLIRLRQRFVEEYEKKNKCRTILIDTPIRSVSTSKKCDRCKAKTMSGRPCMFKATCGEFCKRHSK